MSFNTMVSLGNIDATQHGDMGGGIYGRDQCIQGGWGGSCGDTPQTSRLERARTFGANPAVMTPVCQEP